MFEKLIVYDKFVDSWLANRRCNDHASIMFASFVSSVEPQIINNLRHQKVSGSTASTDVLLFS